MRCVTECNIFIYCIIHTKMKSIKLNKQYVGEFPQCKPSFLPATTVGSFIKQDFTD